MMQDKGLRPNRDPSVRTTGQGAGTIYMDLDLTLTRNEPTMFGEFGGSGSHSCGPSVFADPVGKRVAMRSSTRADERNCLCTPDERNGRVRSVSQCTQASRD